MQVDVLETELQITSQPFQVALNVGGDADMRIQILRAFEASGRFEISGMNRGIASPSRGDVTSQRAAAHVDARPQTDEDERSVV